MSAAHSVTVLLVGVAAAVAVYLADLTWPNLLHRRRRGVMWAVVAVSTVVGALAPVSPTGIAGVDVVYRAVFAFAVTWAAGRARRSARLVAGAVAAVGSVGAWPWSVAAFAGLGLATGSAGIRRPARPFGALVGALEVQALLRLAWPEQTYATAALAAVGALVLVGSGVRNARRHERRRAGIALGVVATAGVAVAVLLGVGLLAIRDDLTAGAQAANAGLDAARDGDTTTAVTRLTEARQRLGEADDGLHAGWVQPGRLLPVVGRYLDGGQQLATASTEVLAPALESARLADGDALRIEHATVDLDAVASLVPPLQQTLAAVPEARAAVADLAGEALPRSVAEELADLDDALAHAGDDGEVALSALDLVPRLLGGDGPRRWFVLMQTPAEQRGSGGLMGAYGELVADRGQLRLVRSGPVGELVAPRDERDLGPLADAFERFGEFGPDTWFQNVTVLPDFPTVGAAVVQLYPQAGGSDVDGVISVDPKVLAGLLSLTGPVDVPSWPVPLTADNAERVLLHEQYVELEGAAGGEFIAETIAATFGALQTRPLPPPATVLHTLAPLVDAERLKLYSTHPAEQALFATMDADGAMPAVDGDFFEVVTQNSGESKIDWFQQRELVYDVRYDQVTGAVDATATVTITNDAPAGGLNRVVIGSDLDEEEDRDPSGRSQLWVDLYSALDLDAVTIDGDQAQVHHGRAHDRNVYWTGVTVGPGESMTIVLYLHGLLDPGSPYRLDLGTQPVVRPDDVTVTVRTAGDAAITSAEGVEVNDGVATARFDQQAPHHVTVATE